MRNASHLCHIYLSNVFLLVVQVIPNNSVFFIPRFIPLDELIKVMINEDIRELRGHTLDSLTLKNWS